MLRGARLVTCRCSEVSFRAMKRTASAVVLVLVALLGNAQVKTKKDGHSNQVRKEATQSPGFDLSKPPGTLFLVPYAHLDTEWRWEYPQVIREYLANTLHDNFKLIDKYPHYVFNFSGANRYEMFKEYYPDEYKKLKQYIAEGRWFPAGSSM